MASSRKNRNYKERRPMFAFGQLVLPLAAIIAIGLLFMAVKLLFLSPNENKSTGIPFSPQKSLDELVSNDVPVESRTNEPVEEKSPEKTGIASLPLAGPVDLSDDPVPSTMSAGKADSKNNNSTPSQRENVSQTKETKIKSQKGGKVDEIKLDPKIKSDPAKNKERSSKHTNVKSEKENTVKQAKVQEPIKKLPSVDRKTTEKPLTGQQETKKTDTPLQGEKKRSWVVQIGSFSKKEGAETLLQQAKKDGFSPVISQYPVSGVPFFRVRINAGFDREKAEQVAETLRKKGYPVSVIPIN